VRRGRVLPRSWPKRGNLLTLLAFLLGRDAGRGFGGVGTEAVESGAAVGGTAAKRWGIRGRIGRGGRAAVDNNGTEGGRSPPYDYLRAHSRITSIGDSVRHRGDRPTQLCHA
jgi:hypothetical protein